MNMPDTLHYHEQQQQQLPNTSTLTLLCEIAKVSQGDVVLAKALYRALSRVIPLDGNPAATSTPATTAATPASHFSSMDLSALLMGNNNSTGRQISNHAAVIESLLPHQRSQCATHQTLPTVPLVNHGITSTSTVLPDEQLLMLRLALQQKQQQQQQQQQSMRDTVSRVSPTPTSPSNSGTSSPGNMTPSQSDQTYRGTNHDLALVLAAMQRASATMRPDERNHVPSLAHQQQSCLRGGLTASESPVVAAMLELSGSRNTPPLLPPVPFTTAVSTVTAAAPTTDNASSFLNHPNTSRTTMGSFPQKLFQILQFLESDGRQGTTLRMFVSAIIHTAAGTCHSPPLLFLPLLSSDIASFRVDGPGFEIHKVDEFAQRVLSQHFKMTSFASFQRQLNFYNFTRVASSGDAGVAYFHVKFDKNQPLLLHEMKRARKK